jgi:CheY-like chemotaxis protein
VADHPREGPDARIRELEARLDELRRYEVLGRLIGGIAHDFNNVLSVVTTLTELLIRFGPEDDPAREDLVEIRQAAERGSELTRQIMAFARSEPGDPTSTDVNARIDATVKLVRKLLPEDFEVEVQKGTSVPLAFLDPPEVDQLLLNLTAHARELMRAGGRVRLTTGHSHEGWPVIGMGLEPTRRSVTEAASFGDVMGLGPIEAILERRGGRVVDRSGGRHVELHLPPALGVAREAPRPAGWAGRRALVVESDVRVCESTSRLLDGMGFETGSASGVDDALDRIEKDDPAIVLSAAVLRDGWGGELRRRAKEAGSAAAFLFVTGHASHPAVEEIRGAGLPLLGKPLGVEALERALGALVRGGGPARES